MKNSDAARHDGHSRADSVSGGQPTPQPGSQRPLDPCDRGEVTVYAPTICSVEIAYLAEKERIHTDVKARLDAELQAATSGLILVSPTPGVADAVTRVPDPRCPMCLIASLPPQPCT